MEFIKSESKQSPDALVTVVDVLKPGIKIRHYTIKNKEYAPVGYISDGELDHPVYKIPRSAAERFLQNCGGREFKLLEPGSLTIYVDGKNMARTQKQIMAEVPVLEGGKIVEWKEAPVIPVPAAPVSAALTEARVQSAPSAPSASQKKK